MLSIKKLIDTYKRVENAVVVAELCVGLSLIFVNVVARYVFFKPIPWIEEISVIVLAWAIIIGFSIDLGSRSHICMDVVYDAVKSKTARRFLDIFADAVGLLYSGFITYYGYQAVALQVKSGRVYPVTEFPRWIAYSVIVLVGITMVIRYIFDIIQRFHKKPEEEETVQ